MKVKGIHGKAFCWATLFALLALPCLADEVAVLKNGFSIRHERREVVGNVTRLYTSADGANFVDVPTSQIEHYEAAPDLPPSSAPKLTAHASPHVSPALSFPGTPKRDLSEVVNDASDRYRLDPDLVTSVIKAESGFNAHAVSPKGAQGLMQLMPGTANELGVGNAFDPEANVDGGAKYLRELMERYDFDMIKALAAYNAGPQRVEQFGGVPPYYETRAYVARIVRDFNKKKIAQKKAVAAVPTTAKHSPTSHSTKPKSAAVQASAATNPASTR